ncbi:hypothetical protein JTB14_033475 [Gonioctena quinquepunctata]|nr:hypothetical protein JTB14_033475 [Gonioctena quinquepunctata]
MEAGPYNTRKNRKNSTSQHDVTDSETESYRTKQKSKRKKKSVGTRSETSDTENSAASQIEQEGLEQFEAEINNEIKMEISKNVDKDMKVLRTAHQTISEKSNSPLQIITAGTNTALFEH